MHRIHPLLVLGVLIVAGCTQSTEPEPSPASSTTTATSVSVASAVPPETIPGLPGVAFVHRGVIADRGWAWAHGVAAQAVEERFGDQLRVTSVEGVSHAAAAREVVRRLAEDGHELIFATDPSFAASVISVADEFPETTFLVAGGDQVATNVGTYWGAEYEAWLLAGVAAGAISESGVIGFVAASDDPPVVRSVNAFAIGARQSNAAAEIRVVWTNTMFDPPVEGAAAELLVDGGADVLVSYQDSVATGLVAEGEALPWISWARHGDQSLPETWAANVAWDWTTFYSAVVGDFLEGTLPLGAYTQPGSRLFGSMATGMIDVTFSETQIDAETSATLDELRTQRASGAGPPVFGELIVDSAGQVRTGVGPFDMDFFVEGVSAP